MEKPALTPLWSSDENGTFRSDLLDRAAHDLRNPLAVVRSALEWLEDEIGDREDALDAIRDASIAASRLLVIVDDLHSLARLDRVGIDGGRSMDVAMLVAGVAAAATIRLATRGHTLVSSVPSVISARGDAPLVARSLNALVDACARGAPAGSCIEMHVRVVEEGRAEQAFEIEIGLRGTTPVGPETASFDALSNAGVGVYVALETAKAHGGSLFVIPTATMPRALIRLPNSASRAR